LGNLKLTPEEEESQKKLDDLIASRELGLNKINDQPIPLDLNIGQGRSLIDQAAAQSIPLKTRLAAAQAKRQAAIDVSKAALDFENDRYDQMAKDRETSIAREENDRLRLDEIDYNAALKKYDYQRQDAQRAQTAQTGAQADARDFATKYGVTQPFYNLGGTIYRTSDNKGFATPEEFFAAGGARNFSNAQPITLGAGKTNTAIREIAGREVLISYDDKGNVIKRTDLGSATTGRTGETSKLKPNTVISEADNRGGFNFFYVDQALNKLPITIEQFRKFQELNEVTKDEGGSSDDALF
jgi:hypothetical protein